MHDLTRAFSADTRTVARDQVERIFEERLTALTAGVVQAVVESLAGARREITSKLNQSVRRLRTARSEEQWSKAIVDATQGFADRAALFLVRNCSLHLASARNISGAEQMPATPIGSAPAFANAVQSQDTVVTAFANAVQSQDTVVALRTRSEMSEAIARWAGEDAARKFCLVPIVAKAQVLALLYADAKDHTLETNSLELLATVAGAVIENRTWGDSAQPTLVKIAAPAIHQVDHDLHLKAQRFGRNQVAEMRLYKSQNVKIGRAARNLYTSLKAEIDSARETFRRDFLSAPGGMVDYLHLELVRTLANDDVELLGSDYPGPLV